MMTKLSYHRNKWRDQNWRSGMTTVHFVGRSETVWAILVEGLMRNICVMDQQFCICSLKIFLVLALAAISCLAELIHLGKFGKGLYGEHLCEII